jgi:hypothetical protein
MAQALAHCKQSGYDSEGAIAIVVAALLAVCGRMR